MRNARHSSEKYAAPAGQRVFIVVAAYNEARTVRKVVDRLLMTYSDIVVVDDGSKDATAASLSGSRALVLRHAINRGQGAALQTGIEFALARGADIVVTFDADDQHDAREIDALIQPLLRGQADVTLGSRFQGRTIGMPIGRRIVLKAGVLFTRMFSRVNVSDAHNGLRGFSRQAAASIHIRMDRMAHASEILDQIREGGWRYREVPVTIHYSDRSLAKGQSSWNAVKIALELFMKRALQ